MSFDKIICVGKNYLDHARELGDPVPEKPVLFLKPPSVLKQATAWGQTLVAHFPPDCTEAHYETEIVLQMKQGKIAAVTLGLDMTLRERQSLLKKNGHPWTTGKVFVDAALIGPWIPIQEFQDFMSTPFSFKLDGETKQQAHGQDMTFKPDELIPYINEFFPICENDLIFTGTPAGVGPVKAGSKALLSWGNFQYSVEWHTAPALK